MVTGEWGDDPSEGLYNESLVSYAREKNVSIYCYHVQDESKVHHLTKTRKVKIRLMGWFFIAVQLW